MEPNETADSTSAEDPVARPPDDAEARPGASEPPVLEPEPAAAPPPETAPAAAPAPVADEPLPAPPEAVVPPPEAVVPPPAAITAGPAAEDQVAGEPEPPSGQRRLPTARTAVIAVLVVAVVVESILLFRSGSDERARNEVFDISRRFLSTLTTYNTSTIDGQRERILALATGRFRTEYTQLTGPEFVAALRERQADSKGTVSRLAVTSMEGDNAEVMAVVEVSVTNKDLPAPNVERNVIDLSLVRTGSGWRVDAVSILGSLP